MLPVENTVEPPIMDPLRAHSFFMADATSSTEIYLPLILYIRDPPEADDLQITDSNHSWSTKAFAIQYRLRIATVLLNSIQRTVITVAYAIYTLPHH